MTKDEALRLALEALESADWYIGQLEPFVYYSGNDGIHEERKKVQDAMPILKAALEAKDEPVACKECHLKDTVYDLLGDLKVANLKLSVRSQRTWVGLTDEDEIDWDGGDLKSFVKAIEAKLKEKNT